MFGQHSIVSQERRGLASSVLWNFFRSEATNVGDLLDRPLLDRQTILALEMGSLLCRKNVGTAETQGR
jgi:hypothetical protein